MNDLYKLLIAAFVVTSLYVYMVSVYASGYTARDDYENTIRDKIAAIDIRIDNGTATKKDIAIHEYYVERLETLDEAKKHKHKIK